MNETSLLLYALLFLVAVLYSSVGHGGASGYLALMGIFGIAASTSRPVALILNCVVSSIAFYNYYRKQHFDKTIFLWLALASIPAAYLGGLINLPPLYYKRLLGVLLLLTSIRLAWPNQAETDAPLRNAPIIYLLLTGSILGFLSGLLGIGGGILLSPILVFTRWATIRQTAGISALFILVNSISGLIAQVGKGMDINSSMLLMIGIAMTGGFIGAHWGANKANVLQLKRLLAAALLIASLKLITS